MTAHPKGRLSLRGNEAHVPGLLPGDVLGRAPMHRHGDSLSTMCTQTIRLSLGQRICSALQDVGFANPSVAVSSRREEHTNAIMVRATQRFWEQIGEPKYVRYPETWWDHLKQHINDGKDDFLKYLVGRMAPIEYVTETLEPRAVFKHVGMPSYQRASIQYYTVHNPAPVGAFR